VDHADPLPAAPARRRSEPPAASTARAFPAVANEPTAEAVTPGIAPRQPVPPASDGSGAAAPLPESVAGYIDGIQGRRVFGWAWCRSRPTTPVEVEIRLDDRALLRLRADNPRPDLARTGLTEGRHGFDVKLDQVIGADEAARIAAFGRCGEDEPWVKLVNRAIRSPKPCPAEPGPAVTASERPPMGAVLDAVGRELDGRMVRLRRDLSADVARLLAARPGPARPDGDDEAQDLRRQLSALASSMDLLQMRMNATSAALLEGAAAAPAGRRDDRLLITLVAGLGAVASAALLLGLIAVFG
jgi:hypothetical protein